MAHKEEFKHDAVRENLVRVIDFVKNNRNQVIQYVTIALVAFALIAWYSNNRQKSSQSSISEIGKALNLYIDGKQDLALVDIQSVADNYPGTESADHALIFLIQEHMKNKEYDLAMEEADKVLDESDNKFIKSSMLSIKGDISYNTGDFDSALKFYQQASKKISLKSISDSYLISEARVYIQKNDLAEAKRILDTVIENKDLRFNIKNTAQDLLAEVNYRLK